MSAIDYRSHTISIFCNFYVPHRSIVTEVYVGEFGSIQRAKKI